MGQSWVLGELLSLMKRRKKGHVHTGTEGLVPIGFIS